MIAADLTAKKTATPHKKYHLEFYSIFIDNKIEFQYHVSFDLNF